MSDKSMNTRTTVRLNKRLHERMQDAVDRGEFASVADLIRCACRRLLDQPVRERQAETNLFDWPGSEIDLSRRAPRADWPDDPSGEMWEHEGEEWLDGGGE